jgi:hypothetical protein
MATEKPKVILSLDGVQTPTPGSIEHALQELAARGRVVVLTWTELGHEACGEDDEDSTKHDHARVLATIAREADFVDGVEGNENPNLYFQHSLEGEYPGKTVEDAISLATDAYFT